MNCLLAATAAALSLFSQADLLAAEKYPIVLSRKHQVGQKSEISAVAGEIRHMDITIGGKVQPPPPQQNRHEEVTLVGVQEILELKVDASPAKGRLTIKKCVARSNGDDEEAVFAPGTVVVVTYGEEKTSFAVDGNPLDGRKASVLSKFFETKKSGTDDDELLGTDVLQAVGDRWEIDNKTVAESLSKTGLNLKPEDIVGWMKLERIVEEDGIRCLEIRGEIELKKMPEPELPGIQFSKNSGKMTIRGLFPLDATSQPLQKAVTMTFIAEGSGTADGAALGITISGSNSRDGKLQPVK